MFSVGDSPLILSFQLSQVDQQVLLIPANEQSCEKALRDHRPLPTLEKLSNNCTCYTKHIIPITSY